MEVRKIHNITPFKLNKNNLKGVNFLCKKYNLHNILHNLNYTKKPIKVNYDDCHNNCIRYVDMYGGEIISGYYLVSDENNPDNFVAIKHYVVIKNGSLLDITPNQYYKELTFIMCNDYSDLNNAPNCIEFYFNGVNHISESNLKFYP